MLVLLYDLVDDYIGRREQFRPEHLSLARQAHDSGDLLAAGALSEPFDQALFVWRTDDESVLERFAEADPYVVNGLVTSWRVRTWNVVIGDIG